jgi:catechol 2,3-dioxygenase-like lactoylglutathione lyase family enzyme
MGRGHPLTEYAVPILPSRNLRETLEFYERLGFENRGTPPEEWDYMILGRGGVELHFIAAPDTDPLTTSASCYVFVPDADALHDEWKQVGRTSRPYDRQPPGSPDGHRLRDARVRARRRQRQPRPHRLATAAGLVLRYERELRCHRLPAVVAEQPDVGVARRSG